MSEAAVSNDEFTAFWNNVLYAVQFVGDHRPQTCRMTEAGGDLPRCPEWRRFPADREV